MHFPNLRLYCINWCVSSFNQFLILLRLWWAISATASVAKSSSATLCWAILPTIPSATLLLLYLIKLPSFTQGLHSTIKVILQNLKITSSVNRIYLIQLPLMKISSIFQNRSPSWEKRKIKTEGNGVEGLYSRCLNDVIQVQVHPNIARAQRTVVCFSRFNLHQLSCSEFESEPDDFNIRQLLSWRYWERLTEANNH